MNYPPKSVLNNYQQNPILWIKDVLDDYPRWSKQKEVLDSIRDNRVTLVKSAHGLGKSFLAKDAAMWFLFNFYPSIVVTTAPSFHQVEKVLWAEINESYKHMKVTPGGQCNLTELKLADKWFAKGISPKIDNSEDAGKRITGLHQKHMLIIFDEAPACSPVLWEMKDTLMTSEHVRFLGIGNPVVNSGPFYEGFKEKHYKLSQWAYLKVLILKLIT